MNYLEAFLKGNIRAVKPGTLTDKADKSASVSFGSECSGRSSMSSLRRRRDSNSSVVDGSILIGVLLGIDFGDDHGTLVIGIADSRAIRQRLHSDSVR
jgi:hypothetical protein